MIENLELSIPAKEFELSGIEKKLNIKFPRDYIDFMLKSNGAEGSIGNNYLAMWSAEEIIPLNQAYSVEEFAPGMIIFASDGAGEAYAFDTRGEKVAIINMPFIGMGYDTIKKIGDSFQDFLMYLYKKE